MFRVFTTKEFDNDFKHLDESDKKRVAKIMNQLKEQGGDVGKPLGRDYFREKKFGEKRLYFLIYKQFMIVLAVGISNKKTQQETINKIISEIKEYEKFIIKELEKRN
jgi:mRNA-degrading endonuclease RelE of RelBE toxin-antitoxin system